VDFLKVFLIAADPRSAFTGLAILNYTRRWPPTPLIVWDSLPVLAQFLLLLHSASQPLSSCTSLAYTHLLRPPSMSAANLPGSHLSTPLLLVKML